VLLQCRQGAALKSKSGWRGNRVGHGDGETRRRGATRRGESVGGRRHSTGKRRQTSARGDEARGSNASVGATKAARQTSAGGNDEAEQRVQLC
jgi:hypothetical protein